MNLWEHQSTKETHSHLTSLREERHKWLQQPWASANELGQLMEMLQKKICIIRTTLADIAFLKRYQYQQLFFFFKCGKILLTTIKANWNWKLQEKVTSGRSIASTTCTTTFLTYTPYFNTREVNEVMHPYLCIILYWCLHIGVFSQELFWNVTEGKEQV